MAKGRTLIDIAQLTRIMENKQAKAVIISNWQKIRKITEWNAKRLIDLICEENISQLKRFFSDINS